MTASALHSQVYRILVLLTPGSENTFYMHCLKIVDDSGHRHVLYFTDGNLGRCIVSDALRDMVA